ncbi:MAG: hypothetical protein GF364_12470 [Candidatus Lokiarchaeota archaeon]|nr:hypothetical protein [Candidatus Lokiarchaeota archaeon]
MMGLAKLPRHLIYGAVLLIQICLTLVSTLGGLSSVLILDPNFENVNVKDFDSYIDETTTLFNFTFILNNTGVYDFKDLDMDLYIDAINETDTYRLLEGDYYLAEIPAGEKVVDLVEFNETHFTIPSNFDFLQIDEYNLNVTITFLYSLELINFRIDLAFTGSDLGSLGGI